MTETLLPDSSLYESKKHGVMEYPVAIYHTNLAASNIKYIPWHWHDEVEINIVLTGCALFRANDDTVLLTPGHGQFVNHTTLHSVKPVDENTSCEFYSIVFHPAFLFGYGKTMLSTKYLTPITVSSKWKHFILSHETDWHKHILDICKAISKAHHEQEFGYELYVKEQLCSLWLHILKQFYASEDIRNVSISLSGSTSIDESRVKTAIRYMEQHHTETVTLDDIANAVHISKSECCRCFKRTLHLTPFEYLMRFRIFEATRKMQYADAMTQSIASLAFSVGFNNVSYFNKLFKQYLHCTPKEYRKQLINNANSASGSQSYELHHAAMEFPYNKPS